MSRLAVLAMMLGVVSAARALNRPADIVQVQAELTTKHARTEESNLGNLIADALKSVMGSEIAIVAAAGLADTTIPKGSASVDDFLKALEFRTDTVVVLKISGTKLKDALEHSVSLLPQKNSAFLQVAGLAFDVNPSADRGKRVSNVRVGSALLADSKVYTIAMPSPLANGALAYLKFWDRQDIEKDTGKTLEAAVTAHIKSLKTISGRLEDRIVVKK